MLNDYIGMDTQHDEQHKPAQVSNSSLRQQLFHLIIAPVEHVALQVPRALAVSALAAALDFGIYVSLVKMAHWPAIVAATLSYLLGGVVQYVLCSRWVFPASPGNAAVGFIAFSLLSLVGLGITAGVIWTMHHHWGFDPVPAKVAALGLAFCWNFTSRKYLIFREDRKASPD